MLTAQPGARLVGDQAAKERDALAQAADIAIEVLISSRNLTVSEVSGDSTVAVPDIQMTAIRLKDAAIVGQASASDVLGAGAASAAREIRRSRYNRSDGARVNGGHVAQCEVSGKVGRVILNPRFWES